MGKGLKRHNLSRVIELEKEFVKGKNKFTQIEFTDDFYIYKVECDKGYWYECFIEKISSVQESSVDEFGNTIKTIIPKLGKVTYPRDKSFIIEKDAFECETIEECHEFIKEYHKKNKKHKSPLRYFS